MVRILLRMRSAVASANVSAQSPPTSKNASPRAAAATRSRSTSTSPANTSGGAARRSSKTALRSASSGQTGCCTRGYARHALRAARPSSAEDSEKSWARAGASGLNWFTPPGYAVVAGGGSRIPRSGPSGGAVVAQALLDVRGVLVHRSEERRVGKERSSKGMLVPRKKNEATHRADVTITSASCVDV